MTATANELSPLQAYNLLMAFASRHGENTLRLALHAALPQVLRTDILHLLRLNFVPESMPELAVEADVLFAPFCQDLGNGYYRIDQNVRLQLLQNLDPAYAEESTPRSVLIARFLLSYIEQQSRMGGMAQDRLYADYLEVERWGALGFLDPEAAAAQLAAALQQATLSGEIAVRIRVAGLATALSTPLARYGKLLTYAAGLEAIETGRVDQARKLLEGLGDTEIEIGKIRLKSPRRVLQERLPPMMEIIAEKEDRAAEPQVSKTARNTVFICYSHQDKKWLDQLLRFLKPLEWAVSLELWDDTSLIGSKWQEEFHHALAAAKVAVLLVSPYFLESDYIVNYDLPALLDAAEREGAVILPVILTHCLFEKSELSYFQPINESARPLSRLSSEERDKMLVRIAKKIGENFDSVVESEFEARQESSTATELIKKGIYLSYGRDDDKAPIRKLVVELRHYFGKDLVWMADQRVQSDPTFDDWIRGKVKQAAVMLVVIGPHWLSPTLSKWVNTEVKAALESNISLIPVLVGGARFPSPYDLPGELARLADIQFDVLNDATWSQDFENLIHTLKQLLDETDLKDKAPKDKRAFVPGKLIDVFVSYARSDDEVPLGARAGWVTTFVDELQKLLRRKLGGNGASIWMDYQLVAHDQVTATLMDSVTHSRTLLVLMSPAYLMSVWCRKELGNFLESNSVSKNKENVFIVELEPTERESWHPRLQELTPMRFWQIGRDYVPRLIGFPVPKHDQDDPYWTNLNTLAHLIAKYLGTSPDPDIPDEKDATITPYNIKDGVTSYVSPSSGTKKIIWIAEPTDDLINQWYSLAEAVRQAGAEVRPLGFDTYPRSTEAEFLARLQVDLNSAHLFVQLLSQISGIHPKDGTLSFTALQSSAASAISRQKQCAFLQWRNRDINLDQVTDEHHRRLLTGAIACGFEEFRQQVLAAVQNLNQPSSKPEANNENQSLAISIFAHISDNDLAMQVQDILVELGVYAITTRTEPAPDQSLPEFRDQLHEVFITSDAMIFIYDQAPPVWVQAQYMKARRALAQKHKMLWAALLSGPSIDKPDAGLAGKDLMKLEYREGHLRDELERFVNTLRGEDHA